jgi:hypothetical protein
MVSSHFPEEQDIFGNYSVAENIKNFNKKAGKLSELPGLKLYLK